MSMGSTNKLPISLPMRPGQPGPVVVQPKHGPPPLASEIQDRFKGPPARRNPVPGRPSWQARFWLG
jgi:hypothetical protein